MKIIALYLVALSFPGFFFAFADWPRGLPEELVLTETVVLLIRITSLVYGAASLATGIGLLGRRSWTPAAGRLWMMSCLLMFLGFVLGIPEEMFLGGTIGLGAFLLLTLTIFFFLDKAIARHVKHAT